MLPSIRLYGLSLRGANNTARDVLPAGGEALEKLLGTFSGRFPEAGLMVLGTCVRLEFYVEATESHAEMLHDAVTSVQAEQHCPVADMLSYELHNDAVAGHVFRIATGLESPILGDIHVMSQLRVAESAARRAGSLRPQLSELVRRALVLGKRARRETSISVGGASVGSAVARTVATDHPAGSAGRALVVGAGTAAASVVDALVASGGFHQIDVANRSPERAIALARRGGGEAIPLTGVRASAEAADLVVSALAPGVVFLSPDDSAAVAEANPGLTIIDLVPGGSTAAHPGLAIKTMEDLVDWSDPARLAAVETVEDHCSEALSQWQRWYETQPTEALLAKLYAGLDQTVDDLAGALLADTTPNNSERLAARAVLKAWLHPHVMGIRQLASDPTPDHKTDTKENLTCAR